MEQRQSSDSAKTELCLTGVESGQVANYGRQISLSSQASCFHLHFTKKSVHRVNAPNALCTICNRHHAKDRLSEQFLQQLI